MSIIKKKTNKSPKRSGKTLFTNDRTGRLVPRKYIVTRGDNIETPALVEIVPNYAKCNTCQIFLGKKEEDLADVLDYNCIECFEMQIEEEFSSNSVVITPIEVSKNKRRKK
jgi:hypothetical protein